MNSTADDNADKVDWWDRERLLAAGLSPTVVGWVLRRATHSGHDGRPLLTADEVKLWYAEWRGEGLP